MKNENLRESDEVRDMRKSIEEMEQELKGMDQDIAEARKIPNSEMREVAVRNLEQMRKGAQKMIASFKETYRVMCESEVRMFELTGDAQGTDDSSSD